MNASYIWDVNIHYIILYHHNIHSKIFRKTIFQKNQLRHKIFLKFNIIFTIHGIGIEIRRVT